MNATTRRIFPYLMLVLILAALGWAVSFGTLPKADFTFNNGTEIQTVDPAKATGSPEGRIINALFEGLLRNLPETEASDSHQVIPLEPTTGGVAESYQVSDDGKIVDAKFKTYGCGSAIASSSLATEWLKGTSIDAAAEIKNTQIVEELSLPPVKIHCSVLAEDAIKAAIDDYKRKNGKLTEENAQ